MARPKNTQLFKEDTEVNTSAAGKNNSDGPARKERKKPEGPRKPFYDPEKLSKASLEELATYKEKATTMITNINAEVAKRLAARQKTESLLDTLAGTVQ